MADLHFELVTPDRQVMSEDVHMVVVPGTEGESGSWPARAYGHAQERRIAAYRAAGATPEQMAVTGGFAEMGENGLTVLAESVGQ